MIDPCAPYATTFDVEVEPADRERAAGLRDGLDPARCAEVEVHACPDCPGPCDRHEDADG